MRGNSIRKSTGEKTFEFFNACFMVLVCFVTVYPFINTLAISFNEGMDALRGRIYFFPRKFTLQNYETVFSEKEIINGYFITVSRTILGIISTVFFTGILAYGLSKKNLVGRSIYLKLCVVGMIFNAGLIPTYMLYKELGLLNNFLVYIIPSCVNIWYMILMKTYFEQLPQEIEESAMLDGCSTMKIFLRIVIPMSAPIIATICIFTGVYHWNSWFDAYVFIHDNKLHPIQAYLYRAITLAQTATQDPSQAQLLERIKINVVTVQAATVIITTVPIVFIYSLFQKHFIKGVMIGALKG